MKAVYDILMGVTFLFSLYFLVTGLMAFRKNKIKPKESKLHRFAILIACRNEEEVIGNLIDSLKLLDYPKEYYDIIVIPNNCVDNTREVAEKKGVKIIDIKKETRTKGEVLKYTFRYLKTSDYDAYAIFDADNLVHKDFLKKMNEALNAGFLVVQGFRDAKNPSDNWITGSYTMFYYIQNFFFNKARMSLHGSAAINGTGFIIKKEVIDAYGFNTKTITEDSEFTGLCAINNIQVGFQSDAITYDEHPRRFSDSWRQRKRWSSGTFSCLQLYTKALLSNFVKNKKISSLDMFLFYCAPLMQVISSILPFAFLAVSFILGLIRQEVIIDYSSITFCIFLYLLNILVNIFIVKIYHKKVKDLYLGIIFFPLFILTWVPINFLCLFKKVKTWEPIKHTRNIGIEKISN